MKKNRLTVGQLAKKANVSIRTLQYYDSIDLLKPSALTEAGRRLYDEQDLAILHQIITMKKFGLSLEDIRKRLVPVDNEADVIKVLDNQSAIIQEEIAKASKVLTSINLVRRDIEENNMVDWSKYAKMMELVNDNNEYYWVTKFLDDELLETIQHVYEIDDKADHGMDWFRLGMEKVLDLKARGLAPESQEAQELARKWWDFMDKYSQGDEGMLMKLYEFYSHGDQWPDGFGEMQTQSRTYLERAIQVYMERNKHESSQ